MDYTKLTLDSAQTNQNIIEIEAATLEDALKKGAESLSTSIINLDYEVIQKGSKGFFGIGKKNFIVRVWKTGEIDLTNIRTVVENEEMEEQMPLSFPKDGEARVKIKKSGIYLKVSPPKNGGKPIDLKAVEEVLLRRGVHNYNKSDVKKITNRASDEWEKIGVWIPNPEYDSRLTISISPDEMEATVTMSAPVYSGRTLEPEEVINSLESEGVKYGILYDKIKELCDEEIVNIPVVVARGTPPKHGKDSQIIYKFKTGLEGGPLFDTEEKVVDYRDLGKVQNVLSGQIVAEKIPAQKGEFGRTVTNRVIPARDGKDFPFRVGKNVKLSEDGLKAFAMKDGQVFLSGGEINVREVFEVRGDLDYNIGNVDFVGTVIIRGSIKEGFSVKAAGDVLVSGVIYRSNVLAQGKIVAKGGIKGAKVKAQQSIYAKYIDDSEAEADVDIIATEEIINSQIRAGSRVICILGKGGIIGGRILAGMHIIAKRLGSESYVTTILEAGVDPNMKLKVEEMEQKKNEMQRKYAKLINAKELLEKEKQEKGGLSPSKTNVLQKMLIAQKEYTKKIALFEDKIKKINQYLANLENKGSISSRYTTFPGVNLVIKNAELEIKSEYKSVTFRYHMGHIKPNKYEFVDLERELRDDLKKIRDKDRDKLKEE